MLVFLKMTDGTRVFALIFLFVKTAVYFDIYFILDQKPVQETNVHANSCDVFPQYFLASINIKNS